MKTLTLLLCVMLAGCETSPAWYTSHPDKQTVSVDGHQINIVPRGTNEYDALGGDDGAQTSTPRLKARQIRAVEMASKCKVVAAEFMPASWTLQTIVSCG